MSVALTIGTTCKPFRGAAERIQRNALASWVHLAPRPEVIVFGDEPGVAEICAELGARQVPGIERSEAGTPLVSALVEGLEREAKSDVLALVNADILLTSGLYDAVRHVGERFDRWLLIARRWDLNLDELLDFTASDWEECLVRRARTEGVLVPRFHGVDVFVFPRGAWGAEPLPPFAIGRGRWDSGILYQARRRRLAVVDATAAAPNIHQNHDYSHHPDAARGVLKGPEAVGNKALLGGEAFIFSALNATHLLDEHGLRPNRVWNPVLVLRKLGTLPAQVPALRPLAPAVSALLPAWRGWRRLADGVRRQAAAWRHRLRRSGDAARALYPSTVSAQPLYSREVPPNGGVEDFDKAEAVELNRARLEHLASLGLPLQGRRVLDVGAGPGHLAQFFLQRGCDVVCLEGRAENLERMRELYPRLEIRLFDVERDDWSDLGRFDVVFCYGLLYHLEDPFRAIRQMASVCDDLLLVSTMVADHELPLVRMEEETAAYTQALRSVGCRPTPSFVTLALRTVGFEQVYAPLEPPDHPDFRFSWRNDLSSQRDGHLLRCVFVASRRPLENPALISLFQSADKVR